MHRITVRKIPILVSFLFIFGFFGIANANQLNAKWTELRQEANSLGDAVKNGDAASLVKLRALSKDRTHGPAMHNMGWLLDNGYHLEQDKDAACDWYEKAATTQQYPPSMHGYALCLFAESRDWKSDTTAALGREYMQDAVKLGWTNSAIILSRKILNHPLLAQKDAHKAMQISAEGLQFTRPSKDQFLTLHYLVGMSAILGPRDIDYYREGYSSLSIAVSGGHVRAPEALSQLQGLWVNEVVRRIEFLDEYDTSAAKSHIENCYDNLEDKNVENNLVHFCKQGAEKIFDNVVQLSQDASELSSMVMGDSGEKIRAAHSELRELKKPYRRAQISWEIRFVPKYNARMK